MNRSVFAKAWQKRLTYYEEIVSPAEPAYPSERGMSTPMSRTRSPVRSMSVSPLNIFKLAGYYAWLRWIEECNEQRRQNES
jgi:hypothetical protein